MFKENYLVIKKHIKEKFKNWGIKFFFFCEVEIEYVFSVEIYIGLVLILV